MGVLLAEPLSASGPEGGGCQAFTYQQNEDVDAGEDVLVDFMTDGAVNHIRLRHGDRITLTSANV